MWSATILAALVFGIGHLPAVAALVPLSAALVARTVTLNALGGVVFGWLYWRHSLEAAMLAHGAAHIGFALLAWAFARAGSNSQAAG
jgi:membrane protease YdiL (CAAX protease family)